MRVADKNIAEVFDQGYTIVENFIDKESLAAAQEALWTIHPKPQDYFADPEKHAKYAKSQFAGIQVFPFDKWELNRLAVYPDLIDMAERCPRNLAEFAAVHGVGAVKLKEFGSMFLAAIAKHAA